MKVEVNGIEYPCFKEGRGTKPAIVIGLASLTIQCLSDHLKEQFCFYGSDLYWSDDHEEANYQNKTIEDCSDDIESCRKQWGIDKVLMFAHSATGLVAMEYARKYPEHVEGVVLLGACAFRDAAQTFEDFFEEHASAERKLSFEQAQKKLKEMDLSQLPYKQRYVKEYVSKTAKFYYDFEQDYEHFWDNIRLNQRFIEHYFGHLLQDYDVRDSYSEIKTKIFVATGRHDYIVPPFEWVEVDKKMPNLTLHIFEKSGHYPMMEEATLFDDLLLNWMENECKNLQRKLLGHGR